MKSNFSYADIPYKFLECHVTRDFRLGSAQTSWLGPRQHEEGEGCQEGLEEDAWVFASALCSGGKVLVVQWWLMGIYVLCIETKYTCDVNGLLSACWSIASCVIKHGQLENV